MTLCQSKYFFIHLEPAISNDGKMFSSLQVLAIIQEDSPKPDHLKICIKRQEDSSAGCVLERVVMEPSF